MYDIYTPDARILTVLCIVMVYMYITAMMSWYYCYDVMVLLLCAVSRVTSSRILDRSSSLLSWVRPSLR